MKLKTILGIVLLLSASFSIAQNSSIKGMPFYLGPPFFSDRLLFSLSLGYEHQVSENISVELNGFSIGSSEFFGEGGQLLYGLLPSIRYYFKPTDKSPTAWVSPYFQYYMNSSSRPHTRSEGFFLGGGASIGFRLYFSTKETWFIDLGAGVAYGSYKYTYHREEIPIEDDEGVYMVDYTIPDPEMRWIPRPIVQVGCRF